VVLLGLVGLEKISMLSRQSHRRTQVYLAAGFLAIIPSLLLGMSGPAAAVGILNLVVVGAFIVFDR
jgi:hypothetical protein